MLEMHLSGKRPCYIYFKSTEQYSFPVVQRSPKLTSPQSPTSATKVSLEPRLAKCVQRKNMCSDVSNCSFNSNVIEKKGKLYCSVLLKYI